MNRKSLRDYSMALSEQEYHSYNAWSYSKIARYAKEGFKALAHIDDPVETTPSMEFGSLFDCLMTRPDDYKKTYVSLDNPAPPAERKVFEELVKYTRDAWVEVSQDDLIRAIADAGYQQRWKFETQVQKLKQYLSTWNAIRKNLTVVSESDISDAFEMRNAILSSPYLNSIFRYEDTDDMEYIYQAKFIRFINLSFDKVLVKVMPDLIVVDHANRTVLPVDLKTSSCPSYEFPQQFVNFRYDIQASLYTRVIAETMKDAGYKDYTLMPYLFVDISRSDMVPLAFSYPPSIDSQSEGLCYTSKDKVIQYKGWQTLLSEMISYRDTNAIVPNWISTTSDNSIIDILSSNRLFR